MRNLYFRFFIILVFCSISNLVVAQTVDIWSPLGLNKTPRHCDMTIFKPEKPSQVGVIICPGGSYCYLGLKHEGYNVAKWLNSQGITAFVLRYRVGIFGYHHPSMIQDLQRAISYVRENCDKFGVVSLGVMGFSAGGHLAGMSAEYFDNDFVSEINNLSSPTSLRPDFVAMIYPVVSMTDSLAHINSRRNLLGKSYSKDMQNKMSLEMNVRGDMPPVFLVHCKDDRTVNYKNTVVMKSALESKNVSCEVHIFERGRHGFGISAPSHVDAAGWSDLFLNWLNKLSDNTFTNYTNESLPRN